MIVLPSNPAAMIRRSSQQSAQNSLEQSREASGGLLGGPPASPITANNGGRGLTSALSVTQVGELDSRQVVYGAHRIQQPEDPMQNGRDGGHR